MVTTRWLANPQSRTAWAVPFRQPSQHRKRPPSVPKRLPNQRAATVVSPLAPARSVDAIACREVLGGARRLHSSFYRAAVPAAAALARREGWRLPGTAYRRLEQQLPAVVPGRRRGRRRCRQRWPRRSSNHAFGTGDRRCPRHPPAGPARPSSTARYRVMVHWRWHETPPSASQSSPPPPVRVGSRFTPASGMAVF